MARQHIGESLHEDKIIPGGGQEPAAMSFKGHYPTKKSILACLLATEAVEERRTSLGELPTALKLVECRLELRMTCVHLMTGGVTGTHRGGIGI